MAPHSESEDEDSQNTQNVRFNEQEITVLLTCLRNVINTILPFFKKNTKYRKERKIIKKAKKAKGTIDASNEIRKLCSTIKAVALSVSAARIVEVVHTPAAVEISRSPTEAIPGTSRSHTGAITGFSRHTEPTAGASRSYIETISVTPKNQTEAIAATSIGITEAAVTEISKNYTKFVTDTSTNHKEAIPGTSKSHTEPAVTKKSNSQTTATRSNTEAIPGTSTSHTDAIPGTSRSHIEPAATKKMNSQTTAVGTIPRSDTDAVAGTSRSDTGVVHGTTSSNSETIPGTFTNHAKPAVIKKTNSLTIAVGTTLRSDTVAVAGTSKSHISADPVGTISNTKATPETFRDRTEPAVTKKTNSETTAVGTTPKSDTGVVPGTTRSNGETITRTSTSHREARVTETLHRNETKEVPGTTISHTVPTVTKTSNHNHTKEVPGTTISHIEARVTETLLRNQTKEVPGSTKSRTEARVTETLHRNQTKEVPGTTIRHTEAGVTETSNRNQTKEVPGTTLSHTVPTVAKTSNRKQTKEDPGTTISLTEAAVTETSKNETKRVQFINLKQKNVTNSESITPKSHTKLEAAAASKSHTKLQTPETSQTLNPTNILDLSKPIVAEIPRGQTETVSQTPRNRTEPEGTRISYSPIEPMGTGTKKNLTQSVPAISTDPVVTLRHNCNTHTEAVAGSSRNNTVAVAATSRRHTDTTGGTSGSHTESVPGTSPRTHTGPTSETSRSRKETTGNSRTAEASFTKSHTKNKNAEVSVKRIEALDLRNVSGHTEPSLAGTAKGHTKSIVRRNSSIHIEPVPETSRNNPEAVSSSKSAPGTVVPTTRKLITAMPGDPKSNSERKIFGIPRSPAATGVSEIIKNHIEPVVPGTSNKQTEVKLSHNSKNVAVSGTPKGDRQMTKNFNVNIRDARQEASTSTNLQARNETKVKTSKSDEINANISAKKRNCETNLKRNHANSNHDDPKRPRLDNKCSCKKSIYNDEQHCKHHKIKHNKENYVYKIQDFNKRQDHMKIHEAQNGRIAKDTKSADANKRTATRSESTPNGHIKQASFNLPRSKTTESEIAQKQANTKKITVARSESTPNGHIEQAISTSPRTKTTESKIAQKQANTMKITAARSESTPDEHKHIEQATSNPALTKITYCEIAQKQANAKKRTAAAEQASLSISKNVNSERTKIKSITEQFTPTKIAEAEKAKKAGDDKRKTAQNETDRPETTPKRQIEQAVTNSKLAKKPRTDKDIKSVEANERKTTDTGPNADIGRASPNSTLAKIARKNNEKKPADAKKKTATKSDSALIERTEETIASSTLMKRNSTKADYGHEAKFYPSIDLTSDNDDDELKPPATAVKVATSKPVKDDKKIKNEPIIDISEDTSDVTGESNEIPNAIKEPSPKPADHDQVLIDEPVIDIDEDTCFYDPAEEKASVTIENSGPKPTYDEKILQEEPVVDLTDDLDDVSEQKTSVTIKGSSSNTAGNDTDDVILNLEQGINGKRRSEVARASRTNLTVCNKTINKHRTTLEELETKHAENLLAENVQRENANQNQLDSDTVVVSNFFHPSSSNQNTIQGIITTEQIPAQITERQDDSKKRNDKIVHKSKKPNKKPKNNANQPNPNVVLADVTISTKASVSVSTSSTNAVQKTQKANQNNSAETRNSNTPELSITIRSPPINQGIAKLSVTRSAYPGLLQQSVPQTPRPDVSITASTAASEYRSPILESPKSSAKASKRPSSDLEVSPREQKTNPIGINARSSPTVSSEWVPLITLVSPRHSAGNTESSTNHSNDVTCQPIKPVSTSQKTPSPLGSTARLDLNSNRGGNDSSPVQTPQTHWRRPVPLEIPTSNQATSRWQNSNIRSEALSNRNPTLNDSEPPRPTWHTPVQDLAQVTLGVYPSPNLTTDQPNMPPLLNPVQPANQKIPTAQAFVPSNPPLLPLLIPRHQSTMIDHQRSPMTTRPTWHIPTLPTDL